MSCIYCDAPGKILCGQCLISLRKTLAGAVELVPLLEDEKAGLSVKGAGGGGSGGDPLAHFTQITETLRINLRTLYKVSGITGAPAYTVEALAQYLNNRAYLLQDYAGDTVELRSAINEVVDAVRVCWRAVDNRPEIVLLGHCQNCSTGTIRAIKGHHAGWCPDCDHKYDARILTDQRRERALEELGGKKLTQTEMSIAFASLGLDLKTDRVRRWGDRGKVTKYAGARYLFDEVLDVFERMALSATQGR